MKNKFTKYLSILRYININKKQSGFFVFCQKEINNGQAEKFKNPLGFSANV